MSGRVCAYVCASVCQVTDFDKTNGLYAVKFDDIFESGLTHVEITLAKPRNQKPKIAALSGAYNHHIYAQHFFPKASPSTNYSFAKDVEEQNYSNFIQGFNGNLWDPTLNKVASFKDFLNHPDPAIQNCWLCSRENEYHPLSKDGMGVLEWIQCSDVPCSKMVAYPRIVVDYRPKKDKPWRTRITASRNLLQQIRTMVTQLRTLPAWSSSNVISTAIAQYEIIKQLAAAVGCKKITLVEGYFYHKTRSISFTLCFQ